MQFCHVGFENGQLANCYLILHWELSLACKGFDLIARIPMGDIKMLGILSRMVGNLAPEVSDTAVCISSRTITGPRARARNRKPINHPPSFGCVCWWLLMGGGWSGHKNSWIGVCHGDGCSSTVSFIFLLEMTTGR